MRARTNMEEHEKTLKEALACIKQALDLKDGTDEDVAFYTVLSFVEVSIAVMKKTNPSKVKSEARTIEIKARLAGLPVYEI